MKNIYKLTAGILCALTHFVSMQAAPLDVSTPRKAVPPNVATASNKPMLMLAASKDHSLFGPIYTDFEDLEGNGTIDTTFVPNFKYYGYFDSAKCYTYVNNQFEPNKIATKTTVGNSVKYTCGGTGEWSGNFLNWATMTRMDVVRKLLYGGKRSTDSNGTTVLERANLSMDSHSFTKHYMGTDIRDFTPFTVSNLTKTTGSNSNVYAGLTICNQSDVMGEGGNPIIRIARGNYKLWSTVEGTVCQWGAGTLGSKLARYYYDADKGNGGIRHENNPPNQTNDGATYNSIGPNLNVRVKACVATLIGDEKCQAFPANSTTNFKPYGLFQEFGFSVSGDAARAEFGVLTGSYDRNLTAGALRKNMGDFANEINATTGVFCHSSSSGCPATTTDGRATGVGAIKSFDSLVLYGRGSSNYAGSNVQLPSEMTDGTLPAWGNPMGEMVIQALQYYAGLTSTNPTSTSNDTSEGLTVATWADPLSNTNTTRRNLYGNAICRPMYTMALSSSALSFDGNGATEFAKLPNRSKGTLDSYTNLVGSTEGINGTTNRSVGKVDSNFSSTATTFGETCSGKSISSLYNVSGVCPEAPSIGGTYHVAGAALYANTSKIKTIATPPADLQFVQDALKVKTLTASLSGGAARIEILIPNSNPKRYVYITPESLWAANGNAKKMAGALLTFNAIKFESINTSTAGARIQTGTFVVTWNDSQFGGDYDMDIAGFIRYDVYNPTVVGQPYLLKVTTDIINVGAGWTGTHGFSIIGVTKRDGTNANARYLTHRNLTSDSVLNGSEGHLCENSAYRSGGYSLSNLFSGIHAVASGALHCNAASAWNEVRDANYPVESYFLMTGAQNAILNDPLWYAAKYGYFSSSVKNNDGTFTDVELPSSSASWDRFSADGSTIPDGIPDGYFLARRPDLLEQQLRQALETLARNSNAAPAVSSSQLISEGLKYVAKFDSSRVEGNIEAYKVDRLGAFEATPAWSAGQILQKRTSLDNGNSRQIITNSGNTNTSGVAFRWASLPSDYKTQLMTGGNNDVNEANGQIVINYMRGDQSLEAISTGLRVRGDNVLGPIVNATPWIQDRPSANFAATQHPGYRTFANTHKNRDKLLWVAANDGMLHAFNPKSDPAQGGGAEVFAYVPGVLANRLVEIPLQRGSIGRTRLNNANFTTNTAESLPEGTTWAYVDGSPVTGDVCVASCSTTSAVWKTYVFSSLGRGGRALFALDATSVSTLSSGESSASSIFKWQFTSDDDADLGYIVNDVSINTSTGQPSSIVKLNNGKFAYIVGNGQKSGSGKAALFILFVEGPDASGSWTGKYKKIVADAGSGNGLSNPAWVDIDGNGTADLVYAGDLKGNMWKFDLRNANPSNWTVAYKNGSTLLPLFTAKDGTKVLSITSSPEIIFPKFGGLLIAFGTGNAFEEADFPKTDRTQRVFGIWDRPDFAVTGGRALPNSNLSTLVQRNFVRQSNGTVIVTGTVTALDWSTHDGWYLNLSGTSEMILADPLMRAGILTLTSVRQRSGTDNCINTPSVTLYAFDPIDGIPKKNVQGTTDVTVDGVVTKVLIAGKEIQDQKVRVVNDRTVKNYTTECKKGEAGCTCTTSNGAETCTKSDPPTCSAGQASLRVIGQGADLSLCYNSSARKQWREIPGLRTWTN
jgi:type IV pilus assembly protein PilY1